MKSVPLLLAVLMVAGAVTGCGSVVNGGGGGDGAGGTGGSGGSPDPAAAAAGPCAEHAAVLCQKEIQCRGSDWEVVLGPQDVCTERVTAKCISRATLPETGLTPATVAACTALLSSSDCNVLTDVPAECQFKGTKPAQAVCSDGVQCQSGYCSTVWTNGCGDCQNLGVKPCIGAGCDGLPWKCGYPNPTSYCPYGYTCPGDACVDTPKDGESCSTDGWGYGDICNYPADCFEKACTLEIPNCDDLI